jgi:hypothetical protein
MWLLSWPASLLFRATQARLRAARTVCFFTAPAGLCPAARFEQEVFQVERIFDGTTRFDR